MDCYKLYQTNHFAHLCHLNPTKTLSTNNASRQKAREADLIQQGQHWYQVESTDRMNIHYFIQFYFTLNFFLVVSMFYFTFNYLIFLFIITIIFYSFRHICIYLFPPLRKINKQIIYY